MDLDRKSKVAMGEYFIARISPDTPIADDAPETIGVNTFVAQLQTWCRVIAAHPTTDPRNPYILHWQISDGSEQLTGRLGRTGYAVGFQGEPALVVRFALWYRSLVPKHDLFSFWRHDDPKHRSVTLLVTTTADELHAAPLHRRVRQKKADTPPPWRVMPGGLLGKFPPTQPEHSYAAIRHIFDTPDGSLWVSGSTGIGTAVFQHGHWTETSGEIMSGFIWYRDHLWTTGAANHLLRYAADHWQQVSIPFSACHLLQTDSAGTLWAAPREGLWRTTDGHTWDILPLPWAHPFIKVFWIAAPDEIWMTVHGQPEICHWQAGVIELLPLPRKVQGEYEITLLRSDTAGQLWVGTENAGLWRWDGQHWEHIPRVRHMEAFGLIGSHVADICLDEQQRVWVATGRGVSCLMDGDWRSILVAVAPPSEEHVTPIWDVYSWTTCLHLDPLGRLWVGTMDGLLAWIDTTRPAYEQLDQELFVEALPEPIRFGI